MTSTSQPALFTFDIFGTVVDWRRGLIESVRSAPGADRVEVDFDRVIDAQARLETGPFRSYASIVTESVLHLVSGSRPVAEAIGRDAGRWPLFEDSREGLKRLMGIAPCVALTNSDRSHGAAVQETLGFNLDDWVSAEEIGRYKPDPECWRAVARRRSRNPGRDWWHVSAYADYDLEIARALGLTTVFVRRPHARPGPHDHSVRDLVELADLLEALPP